MSILLLRHGQTALNVARVLQPADTPLDALGHSQARRVATRIATLAPVALLASGLRRAQQTAEAVAAATGLPIETEPLLHERDFGDWRGQAWAPLGIEPGTMVAAPPGGESMADFEQRVARAWAAIVRRRGQLAGPLVVVSHGLLIHRLLAAHAGPPPAGLPHAGLGNTSLSVLDERPPHGAQLVGCVRHLD